MIALAKNVELFLQLTINHREHRDYVRLRARARDTAEIDR